MIASFKKKSIMRDRAVSALSANATSRNGATNHIKLACHLNFAYNQSITKDHKFLLVVIASLCNQNSQTSTSHRNLSQLTGYARATIQKKLKFLKDRELIVVKEKSKKGDILITLNCN